MNKLTPEEMALFGGSDWLGEPAPAQAAEPAAVIPPDAPANDPTLPPPEKAKRGRKAKAAEAQSVAASEDNSKPFNYTGAAAVPTLRDQFAAAALQGLLAAGLPVTLAPVEAFKAADEMIKARG